MHFSKTAVVLALLPFSIAATCNSSNATPYKATSSGGGGGSSNQDAIDATFESCASGCGSGASCLVSCLSDACASHCGSSSSSCYSSCLSEPCPAFYGSGSNSPDPDKLQACLKTAAAGQRNSSGKRDLKLEARATLTCSSDETCYSETNGNLFCLVVSTGEYHDIEGGTGNVKSGVYTSGDASSPTTTARTTRATSDASSTTADAATTATSGTTAASGATAAATSTTPNAGEKIRGNAMAGIAGLVLGFVAL